VACRKFIDPTHLPLVQPPQSLYQPPHTLDIDPQPLARLVLRLLAEIQELLNQLAVDKAHRLLFLADLVLERAVLCELNVAERRDKLAEVRLQRHEQVEVVGRDESEEVD
jgi:hypothetical protein